jgi:hypothetical protein
MRFNRRVLSMKTDQRNDPDVEDERCFGCGREPHSGPCLGAPCGVCGDHEGVNHLDGTCRNHDDWMPTTCGAVVPLVAPFYIPGTPDRYYLSNGDPGYPGDPPEFYCPACEGEDCVPVEVMG